MEVLTPSLMTVVALIFAAFIAGYIDTLVGGGGLITIPALMAAGVPPIFALGTNKLQAVAGSGTASFAMLRSKRVAFSEVKWLMLLAFGGSLIGAMTVQFFDASSLNIIIPIVIVFIAIYFLVAPSQATLEAASEKTSSSASTNSAIAGVGAYDGMFGPGTGSFFVWVGVSLRGQAIVESTMIAKTLNFATNIAALVVFIAFGKVLWTIGLMMMTGQILGASLGARSLLSINPAVLRYLVIAVCFATLIAWGIRSM